MTALFYYLLKVILCSGVLFGYYHIALKNKYFHQWNRFYLLSAVGLSLLLPALQFNLFGEGQDHNKAIQLIQVVQSADNFLEEFTASTHKNISPERWISIAYFAVSLFLFISLLYSLQRIASLIRKHNSHWLQQIRFVSTREQGTPFSFFHYIFWNEAISLNTETGQQIFEHELVHVREKHTLDKLFMQALLILFWCNPFFWLIRRELKFIHEFIADKKAIGNQGTAAFAAMIMQTVYPQQYHTITNQFFQTSIKRRLHMLTKIHHPRTAYLGRIIALPLIAFIAFAFTVRTKADLPLNMALQKEIVVVIDAGHGYQNGAGTGARFESITEDAIVLQLAKKIQALNANKNIRIVLTRTTNDLMSLQDRVAIAKNEHADLFISLHTNAADKNMVDNSGIQIYLPSKNESFAKQSQVLGSALDAELAKVYTTNPQLVKQNAGIYVLNNAPCAAVLIECGSITTKKDREFISNEENQTAIARSLLNAIQQYAYSLQANTSSTFSNGPKDIASVDVNNHKNEITITYKDGRSETISAAEARKRGWVNDDYSKNNNDPKKPSATTVIHFKSNSQPTPLYIVDGKELKEEEIAKLHPMDIQSINVLKGEMAQKKYGDKGKNGVLEITMKQGNQQPKINSGSTKADANKSNSSEAITVNQATVRE